MTTLARTYGPMLHPRITVLVRRNGEVQLGWAPGEAIVLRVPGPVAAMPALVRLLDGVRPEGEILCEARALGFSDESTRGLLEVLDDAGLLICEEVPTRLRHVRVHGRGPLSDALLEGLRRIGLRGSHSYPGHAPGTRLERPDLVVLADALVPDPALVAELMRRRIPHLQVRIRDGHGVIGPLVLPGESSCLRCADLLRCDLEPEWPHLSAQLLGRAGYTTPAGIAAAAALALHEIDTIAHGPAEYAPAALNATLELHLDLPHLDVRPWPAHPLCGCLDSTGHLPEDSDEPAMNEIDSAIIDPAARGGSAPELL
ncbi:TOMM precursor leader peptide-binding protein [Nocardia sp. SYP-A9097]|uniref:TOMM precursor leader peptide-binding protein n=1 Tax=Nocardia sp. SYP-A9097 TaxID=2663237 RepID=UPI00129A89B6|nr:TOMM precursor leader peptide-binding protein [Nocardia sp. SYP-A9097]MRH87875.1 TOMM precursor leader peptide-binding protein [Nocardia sp. SYP-A9097]